METVILDTNYWISLKEDSDLHQSFHIAKHEHQFRVLFTRSNLIDLAQRTHQDTLANIISEFADLYISVDNYNDDGYLQSEDPLLLTPPEMRSEHEELTEDFEEQKTLRFLFRHLTQDPDKSYPDLLRQLKSVHDNHGEDRALMSLFGKYINQDGNQLRADLSDAHKLEYVRKRVMLERVKELKKGENVSTNDYVDMEICSYAIYASDIFLCESKWKNIGLISSVSSHIEGLEEPIVVDDFSTFFNIIQD